MTPTLTEQATAYAVEKSAPGAVDAVAIKRAFMAGALAALTTKAPYQSMLSEAISFGRAIGTQAERA